MLSIFMDNFALLLLDLFNINLIIGLIGLVISLLANLVTKGKNSLLRYSFEFFIAYIIAFGIMRIFLNAIVYAYNLI